MKRDYQSYLEQWYEKQEQLEKKGIKMFQNEPSSEAEFNMRYTGTFNEKKLLVKQGKLKTTGNITRAIVEQEAYEYSFKQAKAFKKALAEAEGNFKNLNLQDLRNGENSVASQARQMLFNKAKEIYDKEKKAGKTPEQANKQVRKVVFGSK